MSRTHPFLSPAPLLAGLALWIVLRFASPHLCAAPGDLDATFDPGSGLGGIGAVDSIAVQPDGKIIIGGRFGNVRGLVRPGLARLHPDGRGDSSFDPGAASGPLGLFVVALALQPDGKVLVGGGFTNIGGFSRRGLARLHPDGTVDGAFDASRAVTGSVRSILALPGGQSLILSYAGGQGTVLVRLNADGMADPGFAPPAELVSSIDAMGVQPDGRVVVVVPSTGQLNKILRLNIDGSLDGRFDPNAGVQGGRVQCLVVAGDGKIVISGSFAEVNAKARDNVARLNPDGSLDAEFIPTGFATLNGIGPVAVQPDGAVLLAGDVLRAGDGEPVGIRRLRADGAPDEGFSPKFHRRQGFNGTGSILSLQPDGRILVCGSFDSVDGVNRSRMARLNADGTPDPAFTAVSGIDFRALGVRAQADGKVLVAGSFAGIQGTIRYGITRLNNDGRVDPGFNSPLLPYQRPANPEDGREYNVWGILPQPDGRILVAFLEWPFEPDSDAFIHLARLHPDGGVDEGFSRVQGVSKRFPLSGCLALQPNGQVIIGGYFSDLNGIPRSGLGRVNADGTLDPEFRVRLTHSNDLPYVRAVALQPDGRLLIGGRFDAVHDTRRRHLARLNADGTADTTFNPGTGVEGEAVLAVLPQPNGRILLGGAFSAVNGASRNGIARVHPDGILDTSFHPDPTVASRLVYSMALQPDGKVVIASLMTQDGVTSWQGVARLNPDGSADPTFRTTDSVQQIMAIDLQPDGSLLLAGSFASVNGVARNGLARLFWSDEAFPLSIGRRDGRFLARFRGVPGVPYAFESTTSLTPPQWRDLNSQVAPAADSGVGLGVIELTDPIGPDRQRFYRSRRTSH